MKTISLTILAFLFTMAFTYAQDYQDSQNMQVTTDQEATYPAGPQALIKYLYDNINFSDEACLKEIDSEINVSFDVMPDSTLQNFVLVQGVGYGIDEQLITAMKKLKFQPAKLMGVTVRRNVYQTIPIRTTKMMIEAKKRKEQLLNAKPAGE